MDAERFVLTYEFISEISDINTSEEIEERAIEFLNRNNVHQVIRREILFGLIPKTLAVKTYNRNIKYFLQ